MNRRPAVGVTLRWCAALAVALCAPVQAAAQVQSIQVSVPHRTGAGQLELSAVKITLQLNSSANTTVTVSESASGSLATQSMNLTTTSNDCFSTSQCYADLPNLPAGAAQKDRLIVIKPQQAGADPASSGNDKLVLILRLRSNLNEASSCTSTMTAAETWTIDVGSPRITAASVTSLDKKTTGAGNPNCGTAYRPVPLNDTPLASIVGQPAILSGGRVGVDAVMVLDRSGSMWDKVSTDAGAPTKMTRLGEAAESFIEMWQAIRANECTNFAVTCPATGTAPAIQAPTDRLGVVFFDDAFSWLKTLRPASQISGLMDISTLNLTNEITELKAVTPNGWTSIGGGLLLAAPALAPAGSEPNRKVILLMTDGYQNTNPLVQVTGTQVQTTNGGAPTALPNQPPIQIYGVTVGTGAAVDPVINQQVATASNGFYLNTEDDLDVLPNLFVQVLQNAVKYSTVETMRIVSDTVRSGSAVQMTVPVTSTAYSLAFSLTWPNPRARLRVRFTPPGGGTPIDFVSATGRTLLTGNIAFPREGLAASGGDWTVSISGDTYNYTAANTQQPATVPINFTLLGDDAAVSSAMGPVRAEYAVGKKIRLTAQVNDLEAPLTGLGGQAGASVRAYVVRPGKSVGDVLSDNRVDVPPATGPDTANPTQQQLDAILAKDPNALAYANDVVTLLDNGDAANGDSIANDGIYSGLVEAKTEGHYNFLFHVEGKSAAGGKFVREQLRTIHVRSLPDPDATEITTNVSKSPDGNFVTVKFTPKNVLGGKVGPGWQNFFWLVAPDMPPVKAIDNGDGTYTGIVRFTGDRPPAISLYFLKDPVMRTSDFVPTAADLTDANVVTKDVTHQGGTGPFGYPWWMWIVLVVLILLLIVWAIVRRSGP